LCKYIFETIDDFDVQLMGSYRALSFLYHEGKHRDTDEVRIVIIESNYNVTCYINKGFSLL